jgi:hypothetical protein
MREKFTEYLSKAERQMSEERRGQIIRFAETRLADFLRKFFDPEFLGLYACTDRNFYVDADNKMQINPEMRQVTENESLYGLSLRHYINFLSSKQFRGKERPILAPNEKKAKKVLPASEKTSAQTDPLLPDPEISEEPTNEGKSQQVNITRYERNPQDREKALERDKYQCRVCHMNFESVYGEIGKEYIEVHHLYPVCNMGEDYHFDPLDPEKGLVCLCSNCHSMIHRGGRYEERDGRRVMIPMSLQQLQTMYKERNPGG